VHEGKVTPYFSRGEIDSGHALKGRKLELCWVDPTDAFFLHIQGSGTVKLPHGEELFITYAEKNGQKYVPIGKYLKERLAPLPVTMQRIERVVKMMSEQERSDLFAKNPSYVFFTKSKRRAITSLGVPATPGRTIAVDSKFAPKGALALISFNKPLVDQPESVDSGTHPTTRVSRFVLDQDSGGAITGTDHVDLFWGRGDEAKKVAGILQDKARIVFLVPKR
jgi:membrane-bound lytic murein transglycosylase A